jgi:hypothetical protein
VYFSTFSLPPHDSQKKWREAHPDYLPHYRAQHAEAVERNRERQQRRDQKRRIRRLEKNNLASTQVFIFEQLGGRTSASMRA